MVIPYNCPLGAVELSPYNCPLSADDLSLFLNTIKVDNKMVVLFLNLSKEKRS